MNGMSVWFKFKYAKNFIDCENLTESYISIDDGFRRLWVAVILQAFKDLKYSKSKRSDLRVACLNSISFFKNREHLNSVCHFIDINPNLVYEHFVKICKENNISI